MAPSLVTVLIVSLANLTTVGSVDTYHLHVDHHCTPYLIPDDPSRRRPTPRIDSRAHSYIPHPNPRRHRKVKGWMRDRRGRVTR